MRIVFHSNFMNHHQYFLCRELKKRNVKLYFIENDSLPEEQKKLGYHTYSDDFIIKASDNNKSQIYDLTMSADAVIFGSKPAELFIDRINSGKLTFNFSERLFKKSELQYLLAPLNYPLKKKYLFNKRNTPYILCAGSFVARDYMRLGYPKDKFLKWGYFPEIPADDFKMLASRKSEGSIIWVGRFIALKHPEYVVKLANHLKQNNKKFHIKMIGTGELIETIRRQVQDMQLTDEVELTGAMSPEAVHREFESAEVALVTSNRKEGWGAVVNEALSAGCATVACKQIGSVSYLIRHNQEGLIYDSGDRNAFFNCVKTLLNDSALRLKIAKNGYDRIQQLWNYKVAASRLVDFINTGDRYHDDGPLSEG